MIRNYFKTALRSLFKNKLYTTLNIAGLTFGLSCFLLIGLYLFDELTFDTQHRNADRIYRVIEHRVTNGEATTIAGAGYKLAEEAKKQIAAVENTTRFQRIGRANILSTEHPSVFFQETISVADENFLHVFDFPFAAGDKSTALSEPNAIILTEDLAIKLFNSIDVLGKTIQFSFLESPLRITGILKNHPRNSSFDFNSLMTESSFHNNDSYKQMAASDWLSNNFTVYALLRPNADRQLTAEKMTKLVKANVSTTAGTNFSFTLQPLKDLHLKSADIVDGARNSNVEAVAAGNIGYIRIFSFIALFVLLIAGINYMNLTTARSSRRVKEIGVRKTIGASKQQLIRQFLLESLLITFISFLFSVVVVNLLLPSFNQFTNKQLSLGLSTDYRVWLYAPAFALICGLLSGSYPAFMLSRLKPVALVKNAAIKNTGNLLLRKSLVVFQFTISIVMIISTIMLFRQVRYLNNTDLGFNKDLMVVIDINTGKARSNAETVKAEMAKIPSVKNVTVTSRVPGEWKSYRRIKIKNQGTVAAPGVAYMFGADKDFLNTYGIELLQGRNFNNPNDSTAVIVNETAARMLGISAAAGQVMEVPAVSRGGAFSDFNPDDPFRPKVIGIVKDFHFQSLREKIEPLVLAYSQNPIHQIDYYSARIDGKHVEATLGRLKEVMINNDKNDPFEYHFLDEQLALFYIEDARRQTIVIWAALATIIIACLGLFGLATFAAEQRIKEIGVRKILGATVISLTTLLSKDFLKLVFVANCIAYPIAWWAVNKWLQEYAYHIEAAWWVFAMAAILSIAIALLTVSYQAIRSAMSNPVNSLRSE